MRHNYQISLILDSTGETLDRIFLTLKFQFSNFEYKKKETAASIIRIFDIKKRKIK